MQLRVTRMWATDKSTIGCLDIAGVWQAYTLEPPMRPEKPCAIPAGRYKLALLPSRRFGTYTPHVLNVPGFEAIEIHVGNDAQDTHGCTLVGATRGDDWIGNSKDAFNLLMGQLDAAQAMEIEYCDPVGVQ